MIRFAVCTLVSAALVGSVRAEEFKFPLNGENTKIEFVGKKTDGQHTGGFKKVKGSVTASGADVATSKVEVEIDVASIYSDHPGLTGHLKGADFFDLAKHKTAKFVSTKVEGDKKKFKLTGDFTLRGETKSVTFPVEVAVDGDEYKLTSEFEIDKNEFGMTYGKGKIEDKVTIKLQIKAKKDEVKLPGA